MTRVRRSLHLISKPPQIRYCLNGPRIFGRRLQAVFLIAHRMCCTASPEIPSNNSRKLEETKKKKNDWNSETEMLKVCVQTGNIGILE